MTHRQTSTAALPAVATVLVVALTVLLSPAPVLAQAAGDPFADCAAALVAQPDSWRCCDCYYQVARRESLWSEAAELLETALASRPEQHWLRFYLGRLAYDQGEERAGELFRQAAEGFAAAGGGGDSTLGEAHSRINLYRFYTARDRVDEALAEIEAAGVAAEAHGDPELIAQVELKRLDLLLLLGGDLVEVDRLLGELAAAAAVAESYYLKRDTLLLRGKVAYELGRFSQAQDHYRQLVELARSQGDPLVEATALLNVALAELSLIELAGQIGEPERVRMVELLEEALAAATAAGNVLAEQRARTALGQLIPGLEGRQQLEAAVELARRLDLPLLPRSLGLLAVDLLDEDPAAAEELMLDAQALALSSPQPRRAADGWHERLKVVWATRPPDEAIADSLAVLGYIESLRALQQAEGGQAELFSVWTEGYYWLAGRLLQLAHDSGDRRALAIGVEVAERMRGRILLDAMRSGETPAALAAPGLAAPGLAAPGPATVGPATAQPSADRPAAGAGSGLERQRARLSELVELSRRQLDPALGPDERAAVATRRRQLTAEATGGDGPGPANAPTATPTAIAVASLDQIEAALADDEALLSFLLAPWENVYREFGGGSWLMVTTTAGTAVYPLPERGDIEAKVAIAGGLFEQRQGGAAVTAAAAALYEDLLAQALADLPPSVERLVVIPDGALYLLPFAALQPGSDGPPLAQRYALSIVPSATLWLSWRGGAAVDGAGAPALALVDPTLPPAVAGGGAGSAAPPVAAGLRSGQERLAPLPHARREGRALARRLGAGTEVLIGGAASEARIKAAAGGFRILHLATHALVDDEQPGRSAVVLASGGTQGDRSQDDGLLTQGEIAALSLPGRIVVLSSCRSATGNVLKGEGVMSLARAFFQAGATTVVGSLWPLRDDDAAKFFDGFYRRLGAGASVAEALRATQEERRAAGAPPVAWAGLVALGDGDVVPFPGGLDGGWVGRGGVVVIGIVVVLLVVGLLGWWRHQPN